MADEPQASQQPEQFWVSVVLQRRPSKNRWLSHSWRVTGVVVNSQFNKQLSNPIQIRSTNDEADFLWHGLSVRLYKDEAEDYYHNLMAPEPHLYVITRTNEQGMPEPFLVSASFDEAHAYMEGDEDAHPVPIPPELYGWIEQFVLMHYAPEPRKKRKRNNWKSDHER